MSRRLVERIWAHYRVVLAGAFALAVVASAMAAHLSLRTDFAELLPSQDPAVAELRRITARMGGAELLVITVESPEREANLRLATRLSERLRALGPALVRSVTFDVREERAFFFERRWLYVDLETLERLRDVLQSKIERSKNPLWVDLEAPDDKPEDLIARLKARAKAANGFPSGYLEGEDGRFMVLLVRPPGGLFREHQGEALHNACQRLIDELQPKQFHPAMKVGFAGPIMSALEERAALENDLVWATGLCVFFVCLSVVLFYGRLRAVPLVGIPALIGVAIAFACAELLYGYLNSSTAFLGSIVVGNGINFPIIQMARYEEERRGGKTQLEAAQIALQTTLRPTAVAALGAAIAYVSLCVTRFRGFSQFGVIGGIGMVAAWCATIVVLPALFRAVDHRSSAMVVRRFRVPGEGGFAEMVSRLSTRWPRGLLIGSLVFTTAAVIPFWSYLKDPFEYNFANLRNRRSFVSGSARLNPRIDRVLGRGAVPAVIIAERRGQTEEIRRKILERDKALPGRPMIGEVRIFDDFLPGSIAAQRKKLAVLAEIRALLDDPALRVLDDSQRKELAAARPPETLRPVGDADVPPAMREAFTETDGTLGRVVLVYQAKDVSPWDGRNLMRISDIIGTIPLDDGSTVRTSGHAVIFAAMIRSILHDAPIATLVSLLGVALLVFGLTRGEQGGVIVIATLCAGVAWMLGAAAWAQVRTNFLNFIALPITFGIGVDYGINIFLRYRLEGRGHVGRAVRATGGAVALCSLTTIIGYGALLVADNQGLRSFGEMAILGEVACLIAAVLMMPAFLVWLERRRQHEHAATS